MIRWLLFTFFISITNAQGPPPGPPGARPPHDMDPGRRPPSRGGPRSNPPAKMLTGKWWMNSFVVRRLNLSDDQQKRMDQIFQQTRLHLIDLQSTLDRQEALLDPLLAADHPQEALVVTQIDRVATARAELEKTNARMLFAFRLVLTSEQWKELQRPDLPFGNAPPGRRP